MKKFYLFIFIGLLFLIQYSVLGVFLPSARIPNLFVALAVSLIIIFGFERSVSWVAFAGLFMDMGASWFLGSGALVLILISWLVDRLKVVAELRLKKHLFVLLFGLIIFVSSLAFDIFLRFELEAQRYIFSSVPSLPSVRANLDYLIKLVYSVILGGGVYYFIRQMEILSRPPVAVRRRG